MVDESLIAAVMKTLVLRQAEHRGCCTTAKWLVWFHGAGAREAVREARKRGWAEYLDPQGWRATVVPEPQVGMLTRLRNTPLPAFVWEPGNC
jgi:hypothetical protein